MNYKTFDLELAKQGHPLVTRDGRTVTEFRHFETIKHGQYKNIAVVDGRRFSFSDKGEYVDGCSDSLDLFLAPTEVTMWGNVIRLDDGSYGISRLLWETEAIAQKNSFPNNIATVPVTFNTWKP